MCYHPSRDVPVTESLEVINRTMKHPTLDLDEARRRYEAGEALYKVAEAIGTYRSRLVAEFRKAGVPVRKPGHPMRGTTTTAILVAHGRYLAGESATTIAADLGCDQSTVLRTFDRAGLLVRNSSAAASAWNA